MITLLGPVVDGEQLFATVFYFRERWMILQDGWIKDGVPNIWTYIYDPTYTGDHVLFLEDETVLIFNNLGEYIVNCSLSAEDLLDEIPCPSWSIACELD
jgi:hypothetical protein